jgi:hypothetical protein
VNNSKKIFVIVLGGIGFFIVVMIILLLCFGSVGAIVAYLNGDSVYIYPKRIDLANQEAGTKTIVTFYLNNLTTKEVSIVGEESSCTCAFSDKIPIVAKPRETVEIKVNIHLPKYETNYDQIVSFLVAEPDRLAKHPVQITAKIPKPLKKNVEDHISDNTK